eukprot:GFUD01017765.1.p1 GENE.GFUD01017765.1~~GFUD01017765.1.p1  ORF type:complete len:324 (+),score=60.77 GFUD01017765.1:140-1111(+)
MSIPTSDDFLLTKNNFELCTKNAFKNLINETEFSDVTLACSDDKQILAHKVILGACSPFFKKIFRKNPHQHPLIYLKGVLHKDLEAILEFMYLGETKINKNYLDSFLNAAQELKVDGLIFPEANDSEGKESEGMSKTLEEAAEKHEELSSKKFKVDPEPDIADVNKENYDEFYDHRRESGSFGETDEERAEKNELERENETAGKFKCDLCDVFITHKWNMMRHKVRVHGVTTKESRSPMMSNNTKETSMEMEETDEGSRKIYSCDKCDFNSAHPTSIKRHIQAKHDGIRHKCQVCDFHASQTHDLKRHTSRVHPEEYKNLYNC